MNRVVFIQTLDARGIVAKVSEVFYINHLNIEKNDEFVDVEQGQFFMRTEISGEFDKANLLSQLHNCLQGDVKIDIFSPRKKRALVFCTKENHCLGDLLLRIDSQELDVEIQAVISNHLVLENLVHRFDIPFFYVPAEGVSRVEHESKIQEICQKYEFDFIFLAKYMRILSPEFVDAYKNRIINIHHSFLPAFIGANPYKQAFDRGVKLVGATAHFVNDQLDQGPIIAQDVVRIDHTYNWKDIQKAGRNVEKTVFGRAIELVTSHRVFVYGNKTVVF